MKLERVASKLGAILARGLQHNGLGDENAPTGSRVQKRRAQGGPTGRPMLLALGAAALLASGGQMARAQGSGEITGTVTDPSGAIIPKATVTLVNPANKETKTAVTNGSGIFDFPGLDAGKYTLTIQTSGFETYKKNNIVMNVAQTLKEDVGMLTGGENQTVTVDADALQVQSETSEVSSLITGQQVVQLATTAATSTA